MKKLFLLLALLCALPVYGQTSTATSPTQATAKGNITAAGTTCNTTNACINIHLANNISNIAVTTTGTFSATGVAESSSDFGVTWTTQGSTITSATVTNFTSVAWTDFRIRASAYVSGTMAVFINTSTAPIVSGGGGSGTVTEVDTTGPITGGPITTTGAVACATCVTSAAALTSGQVITGAGSQAAQASGTTLASLAPLASPTFTGTPLSTTAAVDTNTTQIATTAYVVGQAYAKLASPTFTGTPAAPTAAIGTNTTQLATTAALQAQAGTGYTTTGIPFWSYHVLPPPTGASALSPSAVLNQPRVHSFYMPVPWKITTAVVNVIGNSAAETGDFGWYNSSGSLVWHTGSLTLASIAQVSQAVVSGPISGSPGIYYEAACSSTTTATVEFTNWSTPVTNVIGGANAPAHTFGNDANAGDICTSGVLPSSITIANITNSATGGPAVVMLIP